MSWNIFGKPISNQSQGIIYPNTNCHNNVYSVEFIKKNDLVLTSSKDGSIRVWTIDGKHVGILGSEECWDLNDTLTYASYPPDVVDLQTMEKSIPAKAALLERQMKLKAQVIQKFRSLSINLKLCFIVCFSWTSWNQS